MRRSTSKGLFQLNQKFPGSSPEYIVALKLRRKSFAVQVILSNSSIITFDRRIPTILTKKFCALRILFSFGLNMHQSQTLLPSLLEIELWKYKIAKAQYDPKKGLWLEKHLHFHKLKLLLCLLKHYVFCKVAVEWYLITIYKF